MNLEYPWNIDQDIECVKILITANWIDKLIYQLNLKS